jgi:pimeloyl-ACP methyl ester carboxylesterase
MPAIECNGLRIGYEERGSGDPPFVFIHGWTCDRTFFAQQAEHFSRNHRVVSLDLRGHGESDKPEGDYPIAAYASDIAELMKQLDLGKAVIVGHSMGGITALQLAADHPDTVAAIVMVDPAPLKPPAEQQEALEGLVAATRAGQKEPRENVITNLMFLPTSDPRLVEQVKTLMLSAPDNIAAAAMQGIIDFDGPSVAAKCKVPALHIGAAQPLNPPDVVSELMPHVVNAQTVGGGHFNQLEAPDQVNLMIEAFLECYVR